MIVSMALVLTGALILVLLAKLQRESRAKGRQFTSNVYYSIVYLIVISSALVIFDGYQSIDFYISAIVVAIVLTLRDLRGNQITSKSIKLLLLGVFLIFHSILSNDSNNDLFVSDKNSFLENANYFEFWHSGTNDVIDSICGAESIMSNRTTDSLGDYVPWRERIFETEESYLELFSDRTICNESSTTYTGDAARGQYIGLALISELTGIPLSGEFIAVFLFLFMFFYFKSLLYLFRSLGLKSRSHEFGWSFLTINMHLFYVSFLNGHVGSLMIAPVLVDLLLTLTTRVSTRKVTSSSLMPLIFIALVYPYVLPLILFIQTSVISKRYLNRLEKISQLQRNIFFTASGVAIFLLSYAYLMPVREKASMDFRSWGSFMSGAGPLQFMGFIPGNVMGSEYLGMMNRFFTSIKIDSNLEFLLISFLFLMPLLRFYFIKSKDIPSDWRIILYSLLFLILLILTTSRDSYYLYKVAYIFQFVFLVILSLALSHPKEKIVGNSSAHSKRLDKTMRFYFIGILFLNLSWNALTTYEFMKRNETWFSYKDEILNLQQVKLDNAISTVEESSSQYISNYIVGKLRLPLIKDPQKTIYEFSARRDYEGKVVGFQLSPMKQDVTRIQGKGIFETEFDQGVPFRWVSGFPSNGDNQIDSNLTSNWSGITVEVLNRSIGSQEFSFCASLAPWITAIEAPIRARFKENLIYQGTLTKEQTCQNFVLPRDVDFFILEVAENGKYPSVFDKRRILFRLWGDISQPNFKRPRLIY